MSIDTHHLTRLRQACRAARHRLSPSQQQANSQAIQGYLRASLPWHNLNVALYLAFDGEVNLSPFAVVLRELGAQCFLPALQPDKSLRFASWLADTQLITNRYGIEEPAVTETLAAIDLDVILMPLVAVDARGHRLGMGGGYYDRTLGACLHKPYLIGVAHCCQQVEALTPQPWDVPLDMLVTEQGVHLWQRFHDKEDPS